MDANRQKQNQNKPKKMSGAQRRRLRKEEAVLRGEIPATKRQMRRYWQKVHAHRVENKRQRILNNFEFKYLGPAAANYDEAGEETVRTFRDNNEGGTARTPGQQSGYRIPSLKTWRKIDYRDQATRKPNEENTATQGENIARTPSEQETSVGEKLTTTTSPPSMLAIAHWNHPEQQLSRDQVTSIREEVMTRVAKSGNIPLTDSYFEGGTLIISCGDKSTEEWLDRTFETLTPFQGCRLKLGLAEQLVKVNKVSVYVSRNTGAVTKVEALKALASQNKLRTEEWSVVGEKVDPDGQTLVINVNDESLQVLSEVDYRPYLGLDRVMFRVLERAGEGKSHTVTHADTQYLS
jgi:hypothetical protein